MSAGSAARPGQAAGGGDPGDGERLSKRVAQMLGCSRREAEQTIEGGWVRVVIRMPATLTQPAPAAHEPTPTAELV